MALTQEQKDALSDLLRHAWGSAKDAYDVLAPPGRIVQFDTTDQRIWYANSQALVSQALAWVVIASIDADAAGVVVPPVLAPTDTDEHVGE